MLTYADSDDVTQGPVASLAAGGGAAPDPALPADGPPLYMGPGHPTMHNSVDMDPYDPYYVRSLTSNTHISHGMVDKI